MAKQPKAKGPNKAELARKVKELEAQLAHAYHFASMELPKAANLMASGVMVELTALGGRQIIHPVVIKDGLSQATIDCLHADIVRSFKLATQMKPKGVVF